MTNKKLDVISLAFELQSLESETFEIHDYVELGDMLITSPTAPVAVDGSTSTSSTSTCSSTTSTTSCCA